MKSVDMETLWVMGTSMCTMLGVTVEPGLAAHLAGVATVRRVEDTSPLVRGPRGLVFRGASCVFSLALGPYLSICVSLTLPSFDA